MAGNFVYFISFLHIAIIKGYESDILLRTTCKLSCIDKYELPYEKNLLSRKTYKSLSCIHKECLRCEEFCRLDFKEPCIRQCNVTSTAKRVCLQQCNFLKEIHRKGKPGKCPKTRQGFELVKVGRCKNDWFRCPGLEKCCSNGEIRTCQRAEYSFGSGRTPIPVNIKTKKISSTSVIVSWNFPTNSTWQGATVFFVETRQAARLLRPTNDEYSFWSYAGQTSSMRKNIKFLAPGEWYQIRVIAFSLNGTNGYSLPSDGMRLSAEIRRPSPPGNFKALNAWFENKKIFVNITWTEPLIHDFPVRRYRIVYNKFVDGSKEHYNIIPVTKKKVSGKERSFILINLDPSSIYVVKIQAMLSFRRKKVKGHWATMYLKTPPLKVKHPRTTAKGPVVNTKTDVLDHHGTIECVNVIHSIEGFSSAVLKWNVPDSIESILLEYEPTSCRNGERTVKKKIIANARSDQVTLEDLSQNCQYFVKMKTFYSDRSRAFERSIYFSTYPNVTTTSLTTKAYQKQESNAASRLDFRHIYIVSYIFLILVTILNLEMSVL